MLRDEALEQALARIASVRAGAVVGRAVRAMLVDRGDDLRDGRFELLWAEDVQVCGYARHLGEQTLLVVAMMLTARPSGLGFQAVTAPVVSTAPAPERD